MTDGRGKPGQGLPPETLQQIRSKLTPEAQRAMDALLRQASASPQALLAQAAAALGMTAGQLEAALRDKETFGRLAAGLLADGGKDVDAVRALLAKAGIPLGPDAPGARPGRQ